MAKLADKLDREAESIAAAKLHRQHDGIVADLRDKLAKSESRRKIAEQEADELRTASEFKRDLGDVGGAKHKPFKPKKPSGAATAVVCLTDWHGEERIDPATINGLNEYSLEIAEQRIARIGDNFLRLLDAQRKLSNIRDLVVWIGGDMITGNIHEELAENSPLSPLKACRWAQRQLIGLLDHWRESADMDSVTVVTSYGNHGRTTPKPRIATAAHHSFEFNMYEHMADIYEARGVNDIAFKISTGYHNWLDIQGKQVRFHHGDWLKYNGGVGGIGIPVNKSLNEWNKAQRADYDFFGHWHQHLKFPRWCACNCLIGYGPYALSIKAEYSEPSQTFAVFDRDRPVPVLVQEIYCQ